MRINFFKTLGLLSAFVFWTADLHANQVRVLKLGNQGRAIVSFDNDPGLEDGSRIIVKSQDDEVGDFNEEISVSIVKLKGKKAIVKFPSSRSLRVGEVFELESKTRASKKVQKSKQDEDLANDDEPSNVHKLPLKFGALLGWSYEKDRGGLEAGTDDYGSSYTWKNYQLGVVFRYEFPTLPLGLQSGMIYAKRNYSYSLSTATLGSDVDWGTRNIEIPLEAYFKFNANRKLAITPGLGMNLRYGYGKVSRTVTSTTTSATTTNSDDVSYDTLKLKRLAYELILRTGVDYQVKKLTFFCDGKIHYGLNDRSSDVAQNQKKALSFNITTGVLF